MHLSPRLCTIRSSRSETPASVHVVDADMATTSTVRQKAPTNQRCPAAYASERKSCIPTRTPCIALIAPDAARKALRSLVLDWTPSHS